MSQHPNSYDLIDNKASLISPKTREKGAYSVAKNNKNIIKTFKEQLGI